MNYNCFNKKKVIANLFLVSLSCSILEGFASNSLEDFQIGRSSGRTYNYPITERGKIVSGYHYFNNNDKFELYYNGQCVKAYMPGTLPRHEESSLEIVISKKETPVFKKNILKSPDSLLQIRFFQGIDGCDVSDMELPKNFKIYGNGSRIISLKELENDFADVVIINGHGDAVHRNTDKETAYMPELIDNIDFTINSILEINNTMQPLHWQVYGCGQGALIHDIHRNIDKFIDNTTFIIYGGSKYGIEQQAANMRIRERLYDLINLKEYDPELSFIKTAIKDAEAMFFIKIINRKDHVFKVSGPKFADQVTDWNIDNNFRFYLMTDRNISSNNKDNNKQAFLTTIDANQEDADYQSSLQNLKSKIKDQYDLMGMYKNLYLSSAFKAAARRGNIESTKVLVAGEKIDKIKQAFWSALANDRINIIEYLWPFVTNDINPIIQSKALDIAMKQKSQKCISFFSSLK